MGQTGRTAYKLMEIKRIFSPGPPAGRRKPGICSPKEGNNRGTHCPANMDKPGVITDKQA